MDFVSEPEKPYTHEQLMKLHLDQIGFALVALDIDKIRANESQEARALALISAIFPKLHNLIFAAPLLYRSLHVQNEAVENVKLFVEMIQKDYIANMGEPEPAMKAMIDKFDSMQNQLMVMARCVTEGIEEAAKDIDKTY